MMGCLLRRSNHAESPRAQRAGLCLTQGVWLLAATLFIGCQRSSDASKAPSAAVDSIQRVTEKGPVRLTVRVSPASPRLSDLVEMDIEVTADRKVEITSPAFGNAVGDFLVRDYSERSQKLSAADDSQTRVFHYQLEPVHSGLHLIRAIAIPFVDRREKSEIKDQPGVIESDPIEITISTELTDEVPDLAKLEPMVPPKPIAQTHYSLWFGCIAAVVAVIVGLLWYRRRSRRRIELIPQQTPEEIAQKALAHLLSEDLPSRGLLKEFYVRLTGIVRVFIEGTTGLQAPEQTTEEFLRAMRSAQVFPVDRSERLKEFLEAADMVKFAGQQPGVEQLESSVQRAREFISA